MVVRLWHAAEVARRLEQRPKIVHLEWSVQHMVDAQLERAFHHFWRAEDRQQDDRAFGGEPYHRMRSSFLTTSTRKCGNLQS